MISFTGIPILEDYWRHNPRQRVVFDGRDETPFPLDDLGGIHVLVRRGGMFADAVRRTLDPPGISVAQANGPAAGQSVLHLHFHVIPRRADDDLLFNWELEPGDLDAIGKLADRIRANLE